MPNFFTKLFRRRKILEEDSLFQNEASGKSAQKRSQQPQKKSKSIFQKDKKNRPTSDNDGFGRGAETRNAKKSSKANDTASKRKRTDKGDKAVPQPSPNRLSNSYHHHPFAATGKQEGEKADTKKSAQRQQEQVRDRRDAHETATTNAFPTNFADFDSRKFNMDSKTSPSLSFQNMQHFDQQWTQTQPSHEPFKDTQQKQLQLQRMPNGQLIVQPPLNSNMNKRATVTAPPPPPPPPPPPSISPARMATLSPSAQSDFCLSTDVDDDEYNRIRKEAARNLSPMLDKATASDDDEGSDEDDFYKITKNKYVKGKKEDKPIQKTLGISAFPQDSSYSSKNGRSHQYVSDSENERDLFPAYNGPTVGARDTTTHSTFTHRNLSGNGTVMSKNRPHDYFSDSENEIDPMKQTSSSRFVFDSGFDDAIVSHTLGKSNDSTMNKEDEKISNRPPSPISGPADRMKTKQQFPILQSSSRDKMSASSPNRTSSSFQQQSLLKRQSLNNVKTNAVLYPDSSDSEDVIFERMRSQMSKTKPESPESRGSMNSFPPLKPHMSGVPQQRLQDSFSANSRRGFGNDEVENFSPFENVAPSQYEPNKTRSSRSLADQSPVKDLLAKAKADRQKRLESSSVGGAPSLTAMYRREHNNLKTAGANGISSRPDASHKSYSSRVDESSRSSLDKLSAKVSDEKSDSDSVDGNSEKNDAWLFDEVAGALGPRGIAADLESLGGKSNRSRHSMRSKTSRKDALGTPKRGGIPTDDQSVGSRHSRTSRYSAKSSKSHFSHMSEQSRSVANDLIRLEMQLAMVGTNGMAEIKKLRSSGSVTGENRSIVSSQSSRKSIPSGGLKAIKKTVLAPAGKLGIILANRTDSKGTVVSGVRSTSSLSDKIFPGDRLIAIDGEDVTMMSVSEITSIMARKNDFERELTILSMPNQS